VIAAELLKLRRPALLWGTLGAVAGSSALVNFIIFAVLDEPGMEDDGRPGAELATRAALQTSRGIAVGFGASAGLLGVVALSIFAAQTALEYTNGTLRNLLVREPRRLRLLAGKFTAMVVFATLIALVAAAVSIAVASIAAPHYGVDTGAWFTGAGWSRVWHTWVNVLISMIGYGTLGMSLGLLFRSPISSIAIGLAWLLPLEGILSGLVEGSIRWLPGALLSTIASGGIAQTSYLRAVILSGIYVTAAALFAAFSFRQRDVAS
jgi:ABC-type transport system involved in multi-copper enzyme maturation permease subunit